MIFFSEKLSFCKCKSKQNVYEQNPSIHTCNKRSFSLKKSYFGFTKKQSLLQICPQSDFHQSNLFYVLSPPWKNRYFFENIRRKFQIFCRRYIYTKFFSLKYFDLNANIFFMWLIVTLLDVFLIKTVRSFVKIWK